MPGSEPLLFIRSSPSRTTHESWLKPISLLLLQHVSRLIGFEERGDFSLDHNHNYFLPWLRENLKTEDATHNIDNVVEIFSLTFKLRVSGAPGPAKTSALFLPLKIIPLILWTGELVFLQETRRFQRAFVSSSLLIWSNNLNQLSLRCSSFLLISFAIWFEWILEESNDKKS